MKSEETEFFIDNSKSRATRSEDNKTIFSPDFSQSSNFTGFFSNSRDRWMDFRLFTRKNYRCLICKAVYFDIPRVYRQRQYIHNFCTFSLHIIKILEFFDIFQDRCPLPKRRTQAHFGTQSGHSSYATKTNGS